MSHREAVLVHLTVMLLTCKVGVTIYTRVNVQLSNIWPRFVINANFGADFKIFSSKVHFSSYQLFRIRVLTTLVK